MIDDRTIAQTKKQARRYVHSLPGHIDYDDLVQEGLLAAVQCQERFDPERGASWYTFVYQRVAGAMKDYLRREWSQRNGPRSSIPTREEREDGVMAVETASLNRAVALTDGDVVEVVDLLPDPRPTIYGTTAEAMLDAVDTLPELEAVAVHASLCKRGTLDVVASAYGVSAGRISQHLRAARAKLADMPAFNYATADA